MQASLTFTKLAKLGVRCQRIAFRRASASTAKMPSVNSTEMMEGFLRWIGRCNNGTDNLKTMFPFLVQEEVLGYIDPGFAKHLLQHSCFTERSDSAGRRCIHLDPTLKDEESRSRSVAAVVAALAASGEVTGIRNELYPVAARFGAEAALLLERAAAPHFGIKAYGVHLNGFCRTSDGLKLWVARRSTTKPTWPGRLDHIAAGGQPHGLGLKENVIKECWEEAGIPAKIAAKAKPCGAVSYTSWQETGVKRDVLFVFDLELPESFVPSPQDGEVEAFELWPIERVMDAVAFSDKYKDNCNLVLIDFFVRHGLLDADAPGYLDIVRMLRSGDCS